MIALRALAWIACWLVTTASLLVVLADHALDQVSTPERVEAHLEAQRTFERVGQAIAPRLVAETLRARAPELPDEVVEEAAALTPRLLDEAWLRARIVPALTGALRWLRAEPGTESLPGIEVSLSERVQLAGRLERTRWVEGAVAPRLWQFAIEKVIGIIEHEMPELPLGLTITHETWHATLDVAFGEAWFARTTADWLVPLADWLAGRSSGLSLRLPLESDLAGIAEAQLMSPLVIEHIETELALPQDLTLSREEIGFALRAVVTSEWLRARERDVARTVSDFLSGRSARLEIDLPLIELKERAAEHLATLADERLAKRYNALPVCRWRHLRAAFSGIGDPCRPSNVDYPLAKLLFGFDMVTFVRAHLDEAVPDVWFYDEAQVRARVGSSGWDTFEAMRAAMNDGVTIGTPMLRALTCAASDAARCPLDRARALVIQGVDLDGDELEARLRAEAPEALADLDEARDLLATLSGWRLTLIALAILAAGVGALVAARRGTHGLRVCLFALIPALAGVALLVALALGIDALWLAPLQDSAVATDDWLTASLHELGVALAVAFDRDLVGVMRAGAATLAAIAGAVCVLGLFLHTRRRRSPSPDEA